MDEELNPQQAERVRRLLADARHTEPMPDDVAERLDHVLTDLAAERVTESPDAPSPTPRADSAGVVRLSERRRKVGQLLLAAAVVVVGGVTVGQVVAGSDVGGDESSAGTDDSALRQAPERNQADEEHEAGGGAAADSGPGAVTEHQYSVSKQSAQVVEPDRFAVDARRLRVVATGQESADPAPDSVEVRGMLQRGRCEPGLWGGGRYLRVVYDREAGWLVYRPPRGDTQVVELFLCGEDSAERSATVPYR